MGKWLWRFTQEIDHLWRRLVGVKYGERMESWTSQPVRPSYGCSLWKVSRAGLDSFNRFVDFGVGDSRWIRFMHDG